MRGATRRAEPARPAGWYNTAALEAEALERGQYAKTVLGDAFADRTKRQTIDLIKRDLGTIDLVVYSVASSRRLDPLTGELCTSALKTIGRPFTDKAVDFATGVVRRMTLEAATEDEIRQTVAVMGGADWERWMTALEEARVLEREAVTISFTYVGSERLKPTYRAGTIGRAKEDLEATARRLHARRRRSGGRAHACVMKAMITQSSVALPMSALYAMLLLKTMKATGLHEERIEQLYRLFVRGLYAASPPAVDEAERIRLDDRELRGDVQADVERRWDQVTTETLPALGDREGFSTEFLKISGFGMREIDYGAGVDPVRRLAQTDA